MTQNRPGLPARPSWEDPRGRTPCLPGICEAVPAEAARERSAVTTRWAASRPALGLWTRAGLPLEERWLAGLPAGTRGDLTGDPATDRAALDGWAAERTGGLIPRMPVAEPGRALLVLATALALKVTWLNPFTA
ncbi:hypothetical protein [Streptomyces bambusae]|uniref:Uncharacterized protein n=1 Tax=Streptomyces bambusae TaxID=1550616 RepID=A0ABS6ZDX9_9ACTN|nr:hypothetical protein [Streptomyces bambusae]MBW5485921.1 hypothetical protein [Streptomyces bambusae]